GRCASLDACRRCRNVIAIDERAVTCKPATSAGIDDAPIAEVMEREVVCGDASATAGDVAKLLDAHDAPVVIVVDAAGHAVGVCAPGDLAGAPKSRPIEAVMTPSVVTLFEGATVADAVDAILTRGLTHVPVMGAGRVVGLVTPRAIIAWL